MLVLFKSPILLVIYLGFIFSAQPKSAFSQETIEYFILAGTMEPLMIMTPDDPMAGGLFTEIVKRVFEKSKYTVVPKVMPWQRMTKELVNSDKWIMHGIPEFFEPKIPYRLSETAVFPFNHLAVTLRDRHFEIESVDDLVGKTVILVENYHYPGLDKYLDKPLVGQGNGQISSVRAFNPVGLMKMLAHRRGDVVIGFQPRLLYNLKIAGMSEKEVRFQDISKIIATQLMFVAYSPKLSSSFSKFLNQRLKELKETGELAKILKRYYEPIGLPK